MRSRLCAFFRLTVLALPKAAANVDAAPPGCRSWLAEWILAFVKAIVLVLTRTVGKHDESRIPQVAVRKTHHPGTELG